MTQTSVSAAIHYDFKEEVDEYCEANNISKSEAIKRGLRQLMESDDRYKKSDARKGFEWGMIASALFMMVGAIAWILELGLPFIESYFTPIVVGLGFYVTLDAILKTSVPEYLDERLDSLRERVSVFRRNDRALANGLFIYGAMLVTGAILIIVLTPVFDALFPQIKSLCTVSQCDTGTGYVEDAWNYVAVFFLFLATLHFIRQASVESRRP